MKKQKLLVIVGMPGSGKSVAAEEARRLKISAVKFGEVVYEEVKRRKLALTKENIALVSNWFHSSHVRLMVARLRRKIPKGEFALVDGARDPKQVAELKKHYRIELLAITAPATVRWRRELKRKRTEDIATLADLKKRDKRELGYGLGKLIRKADYRIANTGTRKQLKSKVRKLLLSLTKET
jgi:dephospho-CoA kinase